MGKDFIAKGLIGGLNCEALYWEGLDWNGKNRIGKDGEGLA